MAMQYDVKVSAVKTSVGEIVTPAGGSLARCRIKSLYMRCPTAAGTVTLTDGDGGPQLASFDLPSVANGGSITMLLPGEGVLAETNVYLSAVAAGASVTVVYG
jgi:hypothetical protein